MIALDQVRSALFVPGNRPDRFDKAAASGADLVILDLEDAVPADAKAAARQQVQAWVCAGHPAAIRINGAASEAFAADVEMLEQIHPVAVVLPKAEPEGVEALAGASTTSLPVIALVESAAGVLRVRETCSMRPVARAALGHLDLAGDVGCHPRSSVIGTAADLLALASAAAGLAGPLDGVCTAIDDQDELRRECDLAVRRGYAGKLVIHPRQVPVVDECFRPTPAELAWAQGVLASSDEGAVFRLDGHMVDEPVLRRARRIIAQSQPRHDP